MRLNDRVDIVEYGVTGVDDLGNDVYGETVVKANVPAHVTYESTALDASGRFTLSSELRVITAYMAFDAATHRVRWRGKQYQPDGQPLIRMRGGTPHHLTIPVKLFTG